MGLLPTQITHAKNNMADLSVLIYGPAKIGKSTFCSKADHAIFLSTEPGLNSLDCYQAPIQNWEDLLAVCGELADGKHSFKTMIIDTVDNAYKFCIDYICRKFKIDHESDLGYGKGYALINNEFMRVLNKLAFMPYGLYLVSHSQEKEMETKLGAKYNVTVPTIPDKARRIVLGLVDMILFCDIETKKNPDGTTETRRVIRSTPSIHYMAGDRTGRLPDVLDLDYDKFLARFNNTDPKTAGKHEHENGGNN